jgi:hypothetical protein
MQGHLPVPPQPHVPIGLAPIIGYMATREPQPLEERDPVEPEWWEMDDLDEEDWVPGRQKVMKVTAIILSASLLLAGVGTVLEIVLSAH